MGAFQWALLAAMRLRTWADLGRLVRRGGCYPDSVIVSSLRMWAGILRQARSSHLMGSLIEDRRFGMTGDCRVEISR